LSLFDCDARIAAVEEGCFMNAGTAAERGL